MNFCRWLGQRIRRYFSGVTERDEARVVLAHVRYQQGQVDRTRGYVLSLLTRELGTCGDIERIFERTKYEHYLRQRSEILSLAVECLQIIVAEKGWDQEKQLNPNKRLNTAFWKLQSVEHAVLSSNLSDWMRKQDIPTNPNPIEPVEVVTLEWTDFPEYLLTLDGPIEFTEKIRENLYTLGLLRR